MTEPTDAERDQFEEMMRLETFDDLSRLGDGSYTSYEARVGWIAWQAARRTPAPVGVEPVAVLKFERGTPGRQNEMPRVVSCNWMPDGEYEVYLAAAPTPPTHAQTGAVPLTAKQMESGRDAIFSTGNPYCPCDSKTFRKVAEWVERHHGITHKEGGQHGTE